MRSVRTGASPTVSPTAAPTPTVSTPAPPSGPSTRASVRRAVAAFTALLMLAAAGCSDEPENPTIDRSTQPYRNCDEVACTGQLDSAEYEIRLPQIWNGTLLLYSHGYRGADPLPPDYAPPSRKAQVAYNDGVAKALLDAGYALAGSAWPRNGWAVDDGIRAAEGLYTFFRSEVGVPSRVYVWGDGVGGLVTQQLAEQRQWVSGAAPMCAPLAGTNANFDLALDLTFALRTLIAPDMRISGYSSYEAAKQAYEYAARRVRASLATPAGVARVLMVGALIDASRQTANHNGATAESRLKAVVETILTAMAFATIGRYDLEQRVGGNPSGNQAVNYDARISLGEQAEIDKLAPGTVGSALTALRVAPRIAANTTARIAADRLGTPTGVLRVPTITLHTVADPVVAVQNQRVFADRSLRASGRTADVLTLYMSPKPGFTPPAKYGAGHCAFQDSERVGTIIGLDRWVKSGTRPAPAALAPLLAGPTRQTGFNPLYDPPAWPQKLDD